MSQFLDNLDYIYLENKIRFETKNFQSILLRMLSPFELVTHFNLTTNENLFINQEYANLSPQRQFKKTKNSQRKIENKWDYVEEEMAEYKIEEDSEIELNFPKEKKKTFRRVSGKSSLLGEQTEEILCEWILEQIQKNNFITNNEIMSKAREVSPKDEPFQGSTGWLKRFLNRHPEIKDKLNRVKNLHFHETEEYDGSNPFVLKESDFLREPAYEGQWMQIYNEEEDENQYHSKMNKNKHYKNGNNRDQEEEQEFEEIPDNARKQPSKVNQRSIKPIYSYSKNCYEKVVLNGKDLESCQESKKQTENDEEKKGKVKNMEDSEDD